MVLGDRRKPPSSVTELKWEERTGWLAFWMSSSELPTSNQVFGLIAVLLYH